MTVLEQARKLLTSRTASSGDLDLGIRDAKAEFESAAAEVEKLSEARRSLLLRGTDEQLRNHDEAIAAAGRRRDRAAAIAEELEAKFAKSTNREAEAERHRLYDAALHEIQAVEAMIEKRIPELFAEVADIISRSVDADSLVSRTNSDLPEGAEPLVSPEASIRNRPSLPELIIGERQVSRWVYRASGLMLDDETAARVVATGESTGILPSQSTQSRNDQQVLKQSFREVKFHPAAGVGRVEPLARSLTMPGLRAGDPAFWSAEAFVRGYSQPRQQGTPIEPRRPTEVRYEPI